jgi:iron(III) transport system ATP-binding protein
VQQVGTPLELYDRPANLFVAGFLGAANILHGRVLGAGADSRFETEGGSVPVPPGKAVPPDAKLVLRPQAIDLADPATPPRPGRARLTGVVRQREFLGGFVRYAVSLGRDEALVDVPHRPGGPDPTNGSRVALDLTPDEAVVLAV